jgi:hypothetical protein
MSDDQPQPCKRKHGLTCGCRLTPPDIAERLRRRGFTYAQIEDVLIELNLAARPGLPASARHDRSRSHLSPPDEFGHVHWLGPWPKDGSMPRVMIDGERMSLIHFAFREAGHHDIDRTWPLQRNRALCRDVTCYAAAHWNVESSDRSVPAVADSSALLAMWDADNPRPLKYSTNTWLFDGRRDVCKLGHPVNIHSGALKSAYCPACYRTWRDWKNRRTQYRVDIAAGTLKPSVYAALRAYMHSTDPANWPAPTAGPANTDAPSPDEVAEVLAHMGEPEDDRAPSMEEAVAQMFRDLPDTTHSGS